MGLLVGFPLMLFRFLFVVVRVALPVLLILLVIWLLYRWRRGRTGGDAGGPEPPKEPKEPEFDGPVYTVDYEEVKEDPPSGDTTE